MAASLLALAKSIYYVIPKSVRIPKEAFNKSGNYGTCF